MTFAISFDWSKNTDENGESIFDLSCPNEQLHEFFGYNWETAYGAEHDLLGNNCSPYEGCPCCEDDSGHLAPMMNFIYPLDYDGFVTADKSRGFQLRAKIARETNCVCVENTKTGEWFLALTGGGMDLSFSLAHAYMLAQKWLPLDLLKQLNPGWCKDNLNSKVFAELRKICIEQLESETARLIEQQEKWSKPIKVITQ